MRQWDESGHGRQPRVQVHGASMALWVQTRAREGCTCTPSECRRLDRDRCQPGLERIPDMARSDAGNGQSSAPRKAPNLVLRRIREQERHETREEFAESMARVAREIGEDVFPDAKYVARLETGDIRYPGPVYRRILAELCARPVGELGFGPPPGILVPTSEVSRVPDSSNEGAARTKRTNTVLRDAVIESGLELSQIARTIGIDPKSVQRWITRGVVPHPRHRWKTCEILGRDESELWPEAISVRQGEGGSIAENTSGIVIDAAGAYERSPAVAELSAMLTDYGFGLDRFSSVQSEETSSVADLERDIRVAFNAYQQSRFSSAASRTSMLLADVQLAAQRCKDTERARIQGILALSYQAAASILTKSGEPDLAWIAAERGFNAAESSGNPAIRGSLIRSLAFALHSTGRFEPAMRLVDASADILNGEISNSDAMLSVYGTLILVGSMASARFGDGSRTAEYLREANDAARHLGRDGNHLWTSFGPTNVAIHRVNTAVELGDFQTVLDSNLSLSASAVPIERRVRYMLDIARVHALTGKRDDALGTMLTAERIAPEQVRQHYLSRKVVMTLIRSATGKPSTELSKLAMRVKVAKSSLCKIPQLVSQPHGSRPGYYSLIVARFSWSIRPMVFTGIFPVVM
jgi:hypothetical protein